MSKNNIKDTVCFLNFLELNFKKIILFFKDNFYKVDLKFLTKYEEDIISKFYNSKLDEYTFDSVSICETDETYPIILKLIKRNILESLSIKKKIINYDGFGVKYKLTDKARKKLNKKLNKKLKK